MTNLNIALGWMWSLFIGAFVTLFCAYMFGVLQPSQTRYPWLEGSTASNTSSWILSPSDDDIAHDPSRLNERIQAIDPEAFDHLRRWEESGFAAPFDESWSDRMKALLDRKIELSRSDVAYWNTKRSR